MEEEAQGWGQGTGPRCRSEATKPGRLTKSECKQTSLWEAPGSSSERKPREHIPRSQPSRAPEEGAFNSADIAQASAGRASSSLTSAYK